jgi:hypothetical protein
MLARGIIISVYLSIYPSKGSALAQVHPHNTYQTNKYYWLYEAKALDRNSRVSSRTFGYYKNTTGLSFAEERIGPLAAIVTTIFYLLALYLLVSPNTPENLFASIYSDSLIKTAHQHLLLLVGFDTLIYRKYYDTPPILVGHHIQTSSINQRSQILYAWKGQNSTIIYPAVEYNKKTPQKTSPMSGQ